MPIFKKEVNKDIEEASSLDELRAFKINKPIPVNEEKIVDGILKSINGTSYLMEQNEDKEVSTYSDIKAKFKEFTSSKDIEKYLKVDIDKKISSLLRFSFLSRASVKNPSVSDKELKDIKKMNSKMKENISKLYEIGTDEIQTSKLKKSLLNLDITDKYINDKIEISFDQTIDTDEFEIEECKIEANSLPYFTLQEIQERRNLSLDKLDIDLNNKISYKDWFNEMKYLNAGLVSESYSTLYPLWIDKIQELQKEPTQVNKESILALGWNPELPFIYENRISGTHRFLNRINEFNNILDLSKISIDENEPIDEGLIDEVLQPVYIVITYTKSTFGKVTRALTDAVYTHSGISLSPKLDRIYSYNMSKNGFSIEDLKLYNHEEGCIMALYTVMINNNQMKKIKFFLDQQINNIKNTAYSIPNLLGILINKPIHISNAMVCSQFVDDILKKINIDITKKDSALVTPQDFKNTKNKFLIKLYEGPISKYNPNHVQKKIQKIMRSNFKSIKEEYIEEKELPIRFNNDGDLLIENRNKLDYEAEYAKCHTLLVAYEKADNIDGIKYELCKLWFMNNIIQDKLHTNVNTKQRHELNKARAKIMNDFTKYNKLIAQKEDFNFSEYYKESPYSDILKIDRATIRHTSKIGKSIIKTLLS